MIDMNIKEGRIVVRHSDTPGQFVDEAWIGKIVAVNGKRITFMQGDTQRFLLEKTVACVCDTQDEVDRLVQFNRASYADYMDFMQKARQAWLNLIGGRE